MCPFSRLMCRFLPAGRRTAGRASKSSSAKQIAREFLQKATRLAHENAAVATGAVLASPAERTASQTICTPMQSTVVACNPTSSGLPPPSPVSAAHMAAALASGHVSASRRVCLTRRHRQIDDQLFRNCSCRTAHSVQRSVHRDVNGDCRRSQDQVGQRRVVCRHLARLPLSCSHCSAPAGTGQC